MTTEILKDEMLNEEQLDLVAGGYFMENRVDKAFFTKLNYRMDKVDVETIFAVNGVKFTYNVHGGNDYCVKENGTWIQVPHYVAIGHILNKYDYPGFTGDYTDEDNVKSFLQNNFGIKNLA